MLSCSEQTSAVSRRNKTQQIEIHLKGKIITKSKIAAFLPGGKCYIKENSRWARKRMEAGLFKKHNENVNL